MNIRKHLFRRNILSGAAFVALLLFTVTTWGEENITNAVHMVMKVAFMGKAVSNELVRISQDDGISGDIPATCRRHASEPR